MKCLLILAVTIAVANAGGGLFEPSGILPQTLYLYYFLLFIDVFSLMSLERDRSKKVSAFGNLTLFYLAHIWQFADNFKLITTQCVRKLTHKNSTICYMSVVFCPVRCPCIVCRVFSEFHFIFYFVYLIVSCFCDVHNYLNFLLVTCYHVNQSKNIRLPCAENL